MEDSKGLDTAFSASQGEYLNWVRTDIPTLGRQISVTSHSDLNTGPGQKEHAGGVYWQ